MQIAHFIALLPLLVFLILSLIFYGRGLVHIMTFGYTSVLAYVAVINNWELLFFPILVVTGIITILLFIFSMSKGDWL